MMWIVLLAGAIYTAKELPQAGEMRLDETVDPPVFDPDTVVEIANSTI
jgi:hypothetical protein